MMRLCRVHIGDEVMYARKCMHIWLYVKKSSVLNDGSAQDTALCASAAPHGPMDMSSATSSRAQSPIHVIEPGADANSQTASLAPSQAVLSVAAEHASPSGAPRESASQGVLQCVAVCCSVLQCVVVCWAAAAATGRESTRS